MADDIAQFGCEVRIIGKFELAHSVRLKSMRAPDTPDGTLRNTRLFGHHRGGPMRGLSGRVLQCKRDDSFRRFRSKTRDA